MTSRICGHFFIAGETASLLDVVIQSYGWMALSRVTRAERQFSVLLEPWLCAFLAIGKSG